MEPAVFGSPELVDDSRGAMLGTENLHLTTGWSIGQRKLHVREETFAPVDVHKASSFWSSYIDHKYQHCREVVKFWVMVGTIQE